MEKGTSEETTRGVTVSVRSAFVPERSSEASLEFFFIYHVSIRNHGDDPVQLVSRHWIITNASGVTQEVRGLGVVGQQPVIQPGGVFEYTSFCPLDTPVGSMEGWFHMLGSDGDEFDARIEAFTLATPYALN